LNQQASIPPPTGVVVEGLFMVPFARNNNFVGQNSLIEELGAKLEGENRHNRVALVGLGGIG